MADILGRDVQVPQKAQLTAIGGAIHGAVAAGVIVDFAEGARRYGANEVSTYQPDLRSRPIYDALYAIYRDLGADNSNRTAMQRLATLEG